MERNDEGEYEVVLGNTKLLSGFFIVVVLLAVFFAMGYIIGRNSAPSVSASSGATNSLPARMAPPATDSSPPAGARPNGELAQETAAPPQKSGAQQPATHPAAPPPAEAPNEQPAAQLESGPGRLFLQVMAVKQPQAVAVVDTLKKSGFPALLGDSPDGVKYRVLVGPYADAAELGRAKADLENAGFRPIMRK